MDDVLSRRRLAVNPLHLEPARGLPVRFPFQDAMRLPVHVEDVAEMIARLVEDRASRYPVDDSGGYGKNPGELALLVMRFLPDARGARMRHLGWV